MVATLNKPTVGEYESTKAPTIDEYESQKYPAPTEWLRTREVPDVLSKAGRPRWDEFIDATARGAARVGSAGYQAGALMEEFPPMTGAGMRPQDPLTPRQIQTRKKSALKLRKNADFLWELSQHPELAAQNKDLASKALNLIGETIPYITATTAGYVTLGPLGGFTVGSMVEGNSAYRNARDYFKAENKGKPLTPEQEKLCKKIGVGVGVVSGAVEAFGGKYAEQLLLKATAKLKTKMAKAGAVFGIGTIVEALEEGAQEIAAITGEETYRDVPWNERVSRTLGAMAGGGFLGGAMRGGSMAARRTTGAISPKEKAQERLVVSRVKPIETPTAEALREEPRATIVKQEQRERMFTLPGYEISPQEEMPLSKGYAEKPTKIEKPPKPPVARAAVLPKKEPPKVAEYEAKPVAKAEPAVDYSNLNPKQDITISTEEGKFTMTVEDAVYRLDELSEPEYFDGLPVEEAAIAQQEIREITKALNKLQPVAKAEPAPTDISKENNARLGGPGTIPSRDLDLLTGETALGRSNAFLIDEAQKRLKKAITDTSALVEELQEKAPDYEELAFFRDALEYMQKVEKLGATKVDWLEEGIKEAEPAKVEKKPWEMTRGEYTGKKPQEFTQEMNKYQARYQQHGWAVEEALEQGKPVPREVLEEYKSEEWAQEALKEVEKGLTKAEQKEFEKLKDDFNRQLIGFGSPEAKRLVELERKSLGKEVEKPEAKIEGKLAEHPTEAQNFRYKLSQTGSARTPTGIDYKIVDTSLPGENPVYVVERVIKGDRQTIVGFRGEKFESRTQALSWADADAKQKDAELKTAEEKALKEIREKPTEPQKQAEKIEKKIPEKKEVPKRKPKEFTMAAETTADFPVRSDTLLPQRVGGVMKYTDKTGREGEWRGGITKVGDFLKRFARAVPEFTVDPVFTVSKDKMIVYQDGGRFQFKPKAFGIDAKELVEGDKIQVNLESYGIRVASVKKHVEVKKLSLRPPAQVKGKPPSKITSGYPPVEFEFTGRWSIQERKARHIPTPSVKGQQLKARKFKVPIYRSAKGEEILYMEGAVEIPKGKPGKLDVTQLLKVHQTFMKVLEPARAVEMKLGKEAYAAVIKGIHQTDVGRIEFTEAELVGHDKTIGKLGEWFNKFSDKDLRNLMLSRGQPTTVNAELIQQNAINNLPKDLRGKKVQNAIEQIANFNYAYLQKVAGDDINKVVDYFYGIYKDPQKVDRFLDYWRTTKRFTKEKKLPTVADAVDYGLGLRNYNPVENLKAEYIAISHLDGMNWLKDELMRTGKGKFIDETLASPMDWRKVNDPVFRDLRLQPDLAHLINNLIATNKITKVPTLNTLRQINNVTRTVKFIGSAFHLLSVAKQSVADSGYLGFLYKPTALRGFTRGFRANDPIFRTTAYKDYIRHGGGHRYSVESEARRTFSRAVDELNRNMGMAVKVGALPLKIPTGFVNWMFQSYIPKVKYSKFLDVVAEQEKKLGRVLTSPEKIDIIKEQQNFYGMMNERLFGRSGTVTSALRFYFMSPGYAEGNYRTMLKAATQWGGKGGFKANRSRSNIINSWLITGIAATVGTLAFTGKPPEKPETLEDARDLFKIDTGKSDEKGRKIMIDMLTYDKDYWNVAFNILRLRPDVAVGKSWKRIGGMKAPTAEIIVDLSLMSMGKAIYDWKGDRVVEITDPFLQKAMKLTTYEVKNLVPISVSVFQQSKKRDIDTTVAAIETLMGLRPTKTEKDIREQKLISKMYSLAGQKEEMSYYIGQSTDPKRTVERYNKTVNGILESPYIPKSMKDEWGPKLLVDYENVVTWKRFPAGKMTDAELQRAFDAHTLSVPYKRRGEPFRPIGAPKKGSERRVGELKDEAQKRGIELKRGPRKPPRR